VLDLKSNIKRIIVSSNTLRNYYGQYQTYEFDRRYRELVEYYNGLSEDDPQSYSIESHRDRVANVLSKRGWIPERKSPGNVSTYCFIPSNWSHQNQIYNAVQRLGPAHRFDYKSEGYSIEGLSKDKSGFTKETMNRKFLENFEKLHKIKNFDWIFCYALPWDLSVNTFKILNEKFGIPVINLSLDDKNWWKGVHRRNPETGLVNLVKSFDATWTSSKITVPWHWHEGGQAIYLPEGVNSEVFSPDQSAKLEYDVVFIGSRFGHRSEIIEKIRRCGLKVFAAGDGWENGKVSSKDMIKLFNSSKIILGIGDMSYSKWLTNLKGRDFEAPSIGKGIYLTTYNRDLAECFDIGKEIYCYRGNDEMLESILDLTRNFNNIQSGVYARNRCLSCHQWVNRIETLLTFLRIM
jgi:hypothetical protein